MISENIEIGFKIMDKEMLRYCCAKISNFEYRFSYNVQLQKVELPLLTYYYTKKRNINNWFKWVIFSINHEYLHGIIHILEDYETCGKLDNFHYIGIESGNIEV